MNSKRRDRLRRINWFKQAKVNSDQNKALGKADQPMSKKSSVQKKSTNHHETIASLVERLEKAILKKNLDLIKDILDKLWQHPVRDFRAIRKAQTFLNQKQNSN